MVSFRTLPGQAAHGTATFARSAAHGTADAARTTVRGIRSLRTPVGAPPNLLPTYIFHGISLFQLFFISLATGLTGTKLHDDHVCLLNINDGQVCDFVYTSFPWIVVILFFLNLRAFLIARRRAAGPVIGLTTLFWSLYAWFFYVVVSATILKRGNQATATGYPRTTERRAVIGFAWIVSSLFIADGILGLVDAYINHVPAPEVDLSHAYINTRDETRSTVFTRALAKASGAAPGTLQPAAIKQVDAGEPYYKS